MDVPDEIPDIDLNEQPLVDLGQQCSFCFTHGDSLHEGQLIPIRVKSISHFVHENCLYYSGRNQDETDADVVERTVRFNQKCKLKSCKRRRATVGCWVSSCSAIFHFKCAKLAQGELASGGRFFCQTHVELARNVIRWPDKGAEYLLSNDWSSVPDAFRESVNNSRLNWQRYNVTAFFREDTYPRVRVREIFHGHWSFSYDLLKKEESQYEVIALVEFSKDDFICEYVGKVKLPSTCPNSRSVAEFYVPKSVKLESQFVIDAEEYGNEARYINSVNSWTPKYIQKNASMSTVWCRGQLRIIVYAIQNIKKYQPIIMDFNEHNDSYFEDKTTNEEQKISREKLASGPKVVIPKNEQRNFEKKKEIISGKSEPNNQVNGAQKKTPIKVAEKSDVNGVASTNKGGARKKDRNSKQKNGDLDDDSSTQEYFVGFGSDSEERQPKRSKLKNL